MSVHRRYNTLPGLPMTEHSLTFRGSAYALNPDIHVIMIGIYQRFMKNLINFSKSTLKSMYLNISAVWAMDYIVLISNLVTKNILHRILHFRLKPALKQVFTLCSGMETWHTTFKFHWHQVVCLWSVRFCWGLQAWLFAGYFYKCHL